MKQIIQSGHELTDVGLVSRETGEVKDTVSFIVESGSYVVTPKQQEQRRKAREERIKKAMLRNGKKAEKFVFVDAKINFEGVSPAMVTRLLYLSTYAGYKDEMGKDCPKDLGNPIIKNGIHLQKKDIAEVLQLSERHAANFLKEVCPTYVTEDKNGFLYLDSQSFVRGGLKKKNFKQYQQIYKNGVRRLYEAAKGKKHTQLGYVFMMIPFINIEHNVLCWNPDVKDMDKVLPMSPKEFCITVGYSYSNLNRLMKIYRTVTFDVEGRKEHLCKIISNRNDQPNAMICINPAVIYAGTTQSRLEISRLYFRERTEKPKESP